MLIVVQINKYTTLNNRILTDEDPCTPKFSCDTQTACQQFLTDLRILRNCCSFRGRTQEANTAKQTRQVKTQHFKSNTISILEISLLNKVNTIPVVKLQLSKPAKIRAK